MRNRIMAVFDLDGTLTSVRSVESAFFRYLLRKRKVPFGNLLAAMVFFFRHIFIDPVRALKVNKKYLRNVSHADLSVWAREFMSKNEHRLMQRECLRLIESHGQAGHTTVLITGAPWFLVRCLSFISLFDRVYAVNLETEGGVCTGRITGTHFYGRAKKELIDRFAGESAPDLEESFCYGDSCSDKEIMECFGHPVAVNPDRGLKRIAHKRNWRLFYPQH